MDQPFERVYTVTDYYDGPCGGVADLNGAPHVYRALDLDTKECDPGERPFELSPIASDVLALALEDWAIWLRWRGAFDAGCATVETHPALPEDVARQTELAAVLNHALAIDPSRRRLVRGEFRVREPTAAKLPSGVLRPFEVRWTLIE
jgi:hypothetical protein